MRKLPYFLYISFAFVLFQSAQDSNIHTMLSPVHPFQIYYTKDNAVDTSIIDNDGNMYLTTWELGEKKSDDFEKTQKMCEKKIHRKMIFMNTIDIGTISEDDIKPTLFKENGQCFISQGYGLKAKNGFAPDKFELAISRSHAKSSSYMPVGSSFFIIKKQARYIDVYKDVIKCKIQAEEKNIGAEEDYSDYYTYVSIKSYVDHMKSCLIDANYQIEGNKE